MAGSVRHLIDSDGSFTFDQIDNMGDAWEACEGAYNLLRAAAEAYDPVEAQRYIRRALTIPAEFGEPEVRAWVPEMPPPPERAATTKEDG